LVKIDKIESFKIRWAIKIVLYYFFFMGIKLSWLVIFEYLFWCLYVYVDAIEDVTPRGEMALAVDPVMSTHDWISNTLSW
jgi:hypothetical protein